MVMDRWELRSTDNLRRPGGSLPKPVSCRRCRLYGGQKWVGLIAYTGTRVWIPLGGAIINSLRRFMEADRKCRACGNPHQLKVTGCDLCPGCVKKFPYFISFIEEDFVGVEDITFGRVEVYSNTASNPYAIKELRFQFKDNREILKAFYSFREKWDFKNVSQKELDHVKTVLQSKFYQLSK